MYIYIHMYIYIYICIYIYTCMYIYIQYVNIHIMDNYPLKLGCVEISIQLQIW